MEVGTNIRQWQGLARDRRVTLLELARLTGKSRRTIYAYSSGTRKPSAEWLGLVSGILGEPVR